MKEFRNLIEDRMRSEARLRDIPRMSASETDLEALWNIVGAKKVDLESVLRVQDGESTNSFLLGRGWRLLPSALIGERLSQLHGQEMYFQSDDPSIELPEYWPDDWVPFLDWNGSAFGILDSKNQVLGVELESGNVALWARSLAEFFSTSRATLQDSGRLSIDDLMA